MIGPLPAITAGADAAFVLQAAGLGALFGTALAAWLQRRDPAADTWLPSAAMTLLGAAVGVLIIAGDRLGWW